MNLGKNDKQLSKYIGATIGTYMGEIKLDP